MPGFLLSESAVALCPHGGVARPAAPNPRVIVGGMPTITQSGPWTVAGCSLPPPPVDIGPCLVATWVTGATRVLSMGTPLLLSTSVSLCIPCGLPLLVDSAQVRVTGI
jgi:hypothetical protein